MRFFALLLVSATGASLSAVGKPAGIHWDLFKPLAAGCRATNNGALDLRIKLNPLGDKNGDYGSRLVSGFEEGDTLLIVRTSSAGTHAPAYTLSELDSRQIAPVLFLDEAARADTNDVTEEHVRFVIPPEGNGWALFSNTSSAQGEGEVSITVRCLPRAPSTPPPMS